MRKTTESDEVEKLAVDLPRLMNMLSCGRATAEKIGKDSGASYRIGRKRFYNVRKIRDYIDNLS